MQWIKIYFAENEADASSVRGLLESRGLKVKIVPESASSIIQGPVFHTNSNIPYGIFVIESDKVQAEKILDATV